MLGIIGEVYYIIKHASNKNVPAHHEVLNYRQCFTNYFLARSTCRKYAESSRPIISTIDSATHAKAGIPFLGNPAFVCELTDELFRPVVLRAVGAVNFIAGNRYNDILGLFIRGVCSSPEHAGVWPGNSITNIKLKSELYVVLVYIQFFIGIAYAAVKVFILIVEQNIPFSAGLLTRIKSRVLVTEIRILRD